MGLFGEIRTKDNLFVWDIAADKATQLRQPSCVDGITWLPDSNRLASFNADSICLWDLDQSQEPIASLGDVGEIFGVSVAEHGNLIALCTSTGSVYLVDSVTGDVLPNKLTLPTNIYDVDLSQDGKTLAVACNDGGLRLWNLDTYEQLGPPLMQNAPLYRTKILPGEQTVLSTCVDGTTRIWNIPQPGQVPADQLNRLVEIRTGKRLVNGVALKIPAEEWVALREQAIRENIMLSQADSAASSEGMPDLVPTIPHCDLHEARCRDAEQDKDWFGAHWHLSRMILEDDDNDRQSNWQLFARRARTWTERGEMEQAIADYDAASDLLSRDLSLIHI